MVNATSKSSSKPGRAAPAATREGHIRVGIGGWTFEPWRGSFYPEGLPQAGELAHASRALTAIEINGTYYSTQTPATFAKWRDAAPEGFVFSVKASRFATNRRVLAEAGESIQRFVGSGLAELGAKLGPIVWQFAPTKRFDPLDFGAFVAMLPKAVDGVSLRHVLEVRHESFMSTGFLDLARTRRCAIVFTDSETHPSFADLSTDFVYARLMRAQAGLKAGYAPSALQAWAQRATQWAQGGEPDDLPRVDPAVSETKPRDVFVFFINGAKERAPAAAQALIKRLKAAR